VSESALQKPFLLLQTAEKDSLLILLFFLSYPLESISVVFSFPSKQHRSSEISSYFHFSSKPQDTDLLQDEAYNLPPSYLYLPSPADDPRKYSVYHRFRGEGKDPEISQWSR
jgi:hypothetical protein